MVCLVKAQAAFSPRVPLYTLEPLQRDGEAALICSDIDGLDWIRLTEVVISWGGPHGEVEVRRAKDLFAALKNRGEDLPSGRLVRATFLVKCSDTDTPHLARLIHDELAIGLSEYDGGWAAWLRRRGFIHEI